MILKYIISVLSFCLLLVPSFVSATTVWSNDLISDLDSSVWTLYIVTDQDSALGPLDIIDIYMDTPDPNAINPADLLTATAESVVANQGGTDDFASVPGSSSILVINAVIENEFTPVELAIDIENDVLETLESLLCDVTRCNIQLSGSRFGESWTYDDSTFELVITNGSSGTNVVPVPAAGWLFGSGLLGLVGMARRKKI